MVSSKPRNAESGLGGCRLVHQQLKQEVNPMEHTEDNRMTKTPDNTRGGRMSRKFGEDQMFEKIPETT